MNRLVIIGNGFDLAHGLMTSYKDFIHWYWKQRIEKLSNEQLDESDDGLCGSMPSIEYWFLLHFERTNCYYETSEKVIQKLRNHIPFEKTEKFMSKPGWVETLLAEGRMLQAMRNMDELGTDGESYTHIPEAIRFLEKHKKK